MACLTGPAAGAVITSLIRHSIEKKNSNSENQISWSTKLKWLENMLLGGSALLAFEHIWHGEIIFSFPFLTAVKHGETIAMLKEIATVGSAMTGLVLLIWFGMIFFAEKIASRKESGDSECAL